MSRNEDTGLRRGLFFFTRNFQSESRQTAENAGLFDSAVPDEIPNDSL